jgi:hypothetical protein
MGESVSGPLDCRRGTNLNGECSADEETRLVVFNIDIERHLSLPQYRVQSIMPLKMIRRRTDHRRSGTTYTLIGSFGQEMRLVVKFDDELVGDER